MTTKAQQFLNSTLRDKGIRFAHVKNNQLWEEDFGYGPSDREIAKDWDRAVSVLEKLGWKLDPEAQGFVNGKRYGQALRFEQ